MTTSTTVTRTRDTRPWMLTGSVAALSIAIGLAAGIALGVNLAARVADLCGELDEGLVLSDAFQSRLSEQELRRLGSFPLKGVAAAQTVFAPVGP